MKPPFRTYLRFVIAGISSAACVAALGYFPTVRLAGREAIGAMLAGIGISLLAGLVGAVPIGLASQGDPMKKPQAILLATTIRFIIAAAVTVSVVLSGWFDPVVLGLWVGISYLAMLFVDAICAVRILGNSGADRPRRFSRDPAGSASSVQGTHS